MEPVTTNPTKIATKWALIYTLTAIVLTYAIQYSNLDPASPIRYVVYLPFIIFLILAQKEFKLANKGYLSFSEGFSTGFRFAIFSGLLMALFIYIYTAFLSPEVIEKAMEMQRDKMAEQGLSAGQIDKAMEYGKKLGPIFGAFGTAILDGLLGVIIALIGASILKNDRSPFDNDTVN